MFQHYQVLGSLSLLSDASGQINVESWLGVMGWWVSGLLLGAYNTHQHVLVKPSASAQTIFYYGGWGCTQGGSITIPNDVNWKQVQKINTKKKRPTSHTNIYIVETCASALKPWITVGRCVRTGGVCV